MPDDGIGAGCNHLLILDNLNGARGIAVHLENPEYEQIAEQDGKICYEYPGHR